MYFLQSTEDFMVHLLEDCNLCAIHAKRVTISAFSTAIPVLQVDVYVCAGQSTRLVPCRSIGIGESLTCETHRYLVVAVPKDLQLARRIRGPVFGVSSN